MRATSVGRLAACIVALLASSAPGALHAEEPDDGTLALTPERAVVFKDGYGLVVKRATGTTDAQGRVWTSQVPGGAVLGCFWAATAAGAPRVAAITAEWVESKTEVQREVPAASILDLLVANAGRKVVLGRGGDKVPDLHATILEVLEPAEAPPAATPTPWEDPRSSFRPTHGGQGSAPQATHVLVSDGTERLVLPIASIHTVRGEGLLTKRMRRETQAKRAKRLTLEFGRETAGKVVECRLLYFTTGLRWIPTYRLAGALVDAGELDLQAEILNEVEDLPDVAWDLVVGVPNFRFKEEPSPLALERTLRNVLSRADGSQVLASQMSNVMRNDAVREGEGAGGDAGGLRTAPGLAATGEQDLFVYGVGRRSLAKGARAALPLWSAPVALKHVYTYEVSGGMGAKDGVPQQRRGESPVALERNGVWHQLELTNGRDVPWTTGPALILRDQLPVGQDILTYTPKGAVALLPVTVAVDVRGSYREEETGRVMNALVVGGTTFTRIRRRAFLTLTNHRSEPVDARLTVRIVGEASEPSDDGRVRLEMADDVNARSSVRWDATLPPGATKVFECDLSFLTTR